MGPDVRVMWPLAAEHRCSLRYVARVMLSPRQNLKPDTWCVRICDWRRYGAMPERGGTESEWHSDSEATPGRKAWTHGPHQPVDH